MTVFYTPLPFQKIKVSIISKLHVTQTDLSIVQKMNLSQSWTQPTAVAPKQRPRQCSNAYFSFLIHTIKGVEPKYHIYRANIRLFLAIHRTFLSPTDKTDKSIPIMDPTNNHSSTPTKNKRILHSLHVLPITYYEMMEPKDHIYRPNIRVDVAIT
jgi:hypothetical protein